ncbi:hypothetical protein D6851_12265 [Altericroceibacterium spongiae]|uniref:Uncharacterized protein n=1 Tax=Altericroceibacterium spongiae TaxID=2320269 RepID=A0A420EEW2_9SPHN|nr:YdbH domain-containing protein [Altericroceibacterium spongiae]RKF19239.1 hypothetical protein D6851_12265 [Altericroceibacterium spongiae]
MPKGAQDRDSQAQDGRPKRHFWRWFLCACLLLLAVTLLVAWVNRERIADGLITSELESMGLDARYEIEEIGPRRQVLRNIVIGDPDHPDLTLDRATVLITPRLGIPGIDEIDLQGLRLYGSYRKGKLSFGSLDAILFSGDGGPFEFPDYVLKVDDARGRLGSDYGPIGFKLAGAGHLRGGFAGEFAAVAPLLAIDGCQLKRTSLYGRIGVDAERPTLKGPLRIGETDCASPQLALGSLAMQLDLQLDRNFAGLEGKGNLEGNGLKFQDYGAKGLDGSVQFTFRDSNITARYDVGAADIHAPQLLADALSLDGTLRTRSQFEQISLSGQLGGENVRLGSDYRALLQKAAATTKQTMVGPILTRVDRQLQLAMRDSSLNVDFKLRRNGDASSMVVPRATLRGGDGAILLSLSRFQIGLSSPGMPRLSGNFATGGAGLPRIAGRMERNQVDGDAFLRLRMSRYEADGGSVAIPELLVIQSPDGPLGFSGRVLADGALPGGFAHRLEVPLSGNWSSAYGLALWRRCAKLHFDQLELASLAFGRNSLELCPARGAPILRYGREGLKLVAGTPSLDLAGTLGETPIAIHGGPLGIAYPGVISARDVAVTLGTDEAANRFVLSDLTARIDEGIGGQFAGTDVRLASVPLDIIQAGGTWRYTDGVLALEDGHFRLEDRQAEKRFEPLISEGAHLALRDNVITAEADLLEPTSHRLITEVSILHDLGDSSGHADLAVPGVVFDEDMEVTRLTPLALGVVANMVGVVSGEGRIDWNAAGVTSSGRFSSSALDFAAPFGPVQGASGTVVFSDLLSLTTAPHQHLAIASINPGIEVFDGQVNFRLRDATYLDVEGGNWPFLGGSLQLEPVTVTFGKDEVRRYNFLIEGLNAAKLIDRMDLGNLQVTGTFDGRIPVVFYGEDGRIENGQLLSRSPGGNVAYLGELTYKDLSTMANFAFDTLRSLDYSEMAVTMNGDLTGEIITRVRFDGVKQGEGASSNFITRQIASLPIRFDVNIRAQFYKLITSLRSLYDPTALRDPRELGLLDSEGNAIQMQTSGETEEKTDGAQVPNDEPIQPPESEEMP